MQIVNFAEDYTSDDPSLNPPINESQPNPMRRDTVLSPAGSAYTFRVIMDNPGVWFFHCTYNELPSATAADPFHLQATSSGIWSPVSRCSSLKHLSRYKSATRCRPC